MPPDAPPCPAIDLQLFRQVMGRFATGVTVVSFLHAGQPTGMTVSAFLSASLEPPLVLVSAGRRSRFVADVGLGQRFGINILGEAQRALGPYFANHPRPDAAIRFIDHAGTPLLEGCLAHVVVRVTDIHPAGDHLLYIAAVEHLARGAAAALPLVFFAGRYRQLRAHADNPSPLKPPKG